MLSWFEPGEQVLRLASVLRECRPSGPRPSSSASVSVIRVARPEQSHETRYVIARKGTGTSRCCSDSSRADLCSSQVASHAIGRSASQAPSQDSGLMLRLCSAGRPPLALCSLFLSSLCDLVPLPLMPCRILARASRASHKFTSREIWMPPFFLPRAFSAEMQLTRSQEARSTPTTSRESLVAGWRENRAQATRPSSRLLPARDEVKYIFRTASTQAHQDATNEFPSGTRHTGVRWYHQYPKPYGDGQLRSVPQPAPPLPLPPRRLENGRPVIQEAVPPLSSLFPPPPLPSLQAGHMRGWLLHL